MFRGNSSSAAQENHQSRFYVCPKCDRLYEASYRQGGLSGRIPLILPCKHSICESCIRATVIKGLVKCPMCDNEFKVPKKIKIREEMFPVNYYLLGYLFLKNPNGFIDKSFQLDLLPSGIAFKNCSRLTVKNGSSSESELDAYKLDIEENEKCCQENCRNLAKLACEECDESFCKACCDKLHRSAKGLQSHTIMARYLGLGSTLEKCKIHNNNIEYKCGDCNFELCAHCVILGHRDHAIESITSLEENNPDRLHELLEGAAGVLKRMETTYKEVNRTLQQEAEVQHVSGPEKDICGYFTNLHGRLQLMENKLLRDVQVARNRRNSSLGNVSQQLMENIRILKRLISIGKSIQNPENSAQKLNIRKVLNDLRNSLAAPCFIQYPTECQEQDQSIAFSANEDFEDIEDILAISLADNIGEYKLVGISEMPEGTEIEPPASKESVGTHGSSNASLNIAPSNRTPPSNKKDSVSSYESLYFQKRQEPVSFAKGLIFSVYVKHINSPDSFYVQLKNRQRDFKRFCLKIEQHVKCFATKPILPEKNGIYAVCYEYQNGKSKQWCRGRIQEVLVYPHGDPEKYRVHYIDYGNDQLVPPEMLRELPANLIQEEPFAVHCKLYNLYPAANDWTKEAVTDMAQMITGDYDQIYNKETGLRHLPDREGTIEIMDNEDLSRLEVNLMVMSNDEQATNIGQALKFLGHGRVELSLGEEEMLPSKHQFRLYKMSNIFKENVIENVIITHVKDPYNLHVQMKQNQTYIANLKEDMQKYYKKCKGKKMYSPKIGMPVAVNYTKLQGWVRGLITETLNEGKVKVFLVDYGDNICVRYTMLQKLPERFSTLDMQAINVRLADILPPAEDNNEHWGSNVKEFLCQKYINKEVSMIIKHLITSPMEVYLSECHFNKFICINALLVEQGFARFTLNSNCPVIQDVDGGEIVDEKKRQKQLKREAINISFSAATSNTPNIPNATEAKSASTLKNRVPVSILKIKSPSNFYVKFLNMENELSKLQRELLDYYSDNQPLKQNFHKDDVCVVYSPKNKHYCRARIDETAVKGAKNSVKVFLFDKAEEEIIATDQVFDMEMEFQPLKGKNKCCPYAAIKCHLSGIKPAGDSSKWTLTACDIFADIASKYTELLLAKCGNLNKERCLPVKLWGSRTNPGTALEPSLEEVVLLNDKLVADGLALPDPLTAALIEEWIESPPEVKPHKAPEILDWIDPIQITDKIIQGTPTYVDDDGVIYFHEQSIRDLVLIMEEYIEEELRSVLCCRKYNWNVGDLCTVKYHHNSKWYRGKIVGRNPGSDTYNVKMVDYGNVEDVTLDEMRPEVVQPEVPVFASTCRLVNVFPKDSKGWTTSDIDSLHRLIVDKPCTIEFVQGAAEETDNGGHPLAIVTSNNVNVGELLVKHGRNNLTNLTDRKPVQLDQFLTSIDDDDVVIEEVREGTFSTDSINSTLELPNLQPSPKLTVDSFTTSEEGNVEPLREYKGLNFISDKISVCIINILAYDELIIEDTAAARHLHTNQGWFTEISNKMESSAMEQPALSSDELCTLGTPCIARFNEDGKWYRAQIIEAEEEPPNDENNAEPSVPTVKVWFVDYGNFDHVPLKYIRRIRHDWLQLPVQQFKCKVDGLSQAVDKAYLQEAVSALLLRHAEQIVYAKVVKKEPQLVVRLYSDPQCRCSLFQDIVDCGYLSLDPEPNVMQT